MAPGDIGSVPGLLGLSSTTNIKVIARFRPHNKDELALGDSESIVEFLSDDSCNIETRDFNGSFTFDRVFDMNCHQEDVFNYSFKQNVDDLMKGYNGTVFAYGQTGSGKSYTMMGPNNNIDDPDSRGMIPRIVDRIFEMILNSSADIEYTVKVSYMEIYMERIRDLLKPANDNLPIHEEKARGVYVKGLTEEYVSSSDEVYEVMRQGARVRAVASTNMNQESSRSHSIFVITVAQKNTVSGTQKVGQLSLVDLAGSEKVGKTGASGQTLEEAKKINKSLSALGMVINSLTDGKSTHIPYRDSKLTRILQESLGGNSRTSLIVNCSPSSFNDSETLSTLRFGVRAKTIKNKAKINTELSPLELRQLLQKCQRQLESRLVYSGKLEVEITAWRSGDPPPKDTWILLGGPPTSSLSADGTKKSGHRYSASTSSISSTVSSDGNSRRTSLVSPKPGMSSSRRRSSFVAGTPLQKKANAADTLSSKSELPSGAVTPKLATIQADDSEASISLDNSPSAINRYNTSGDVDTIEEFMRRENELNDQISEKERIINEQEQLLINLRTQVTAITQQNQQQKTQNQAQKKASGELSQINTDLKLQIDNLSYEKKELLITADTLSEENKRLSLELQDAKRQLSEFGLHGKDVSSVSSDTTRDSSTILNNGIDELSTDESIVDDASLPLLLDSLNSADRSESASDSLKVPKVRSSNDIGNVNGNNTIDSDESLTPEALHEKKKQQKMNEILGQYYQTSSNEDSTKSSSRKVSRAVSIADIINRVEHKEVCEYLDSVLEKQNKSFEDRIKTSQVSNDTKAELENLYESRLSTSEETIRQLSLEINRLKNERQDTKPQSAAESKVENESQLQEKNEDLVPVSAMKEKEEQAAAAREQIETMQGHIAQYELLKTSLMQDLQERCERVVELEISLDQAREQYNQAIRSSSNKQQQKKVTLLERNLEQLTTIQRQLVEQNVVLKRDVSMAHKILDARNERIQSLETALRDSQSRLTQESETFETKLTYLRDRLLEVKRGGSAGSNASTPLSVPSLYQPRDQPNSNNPHVLGSPAIFKSPPGSPVTMSSATFPTVASYGPNNRVVHYPDLSGTSSTGPTASRSISGSLSSKIVKPLRGGNANLGHTSSIRGSSANNNTNSGAQTPILQKANEITRSATGLWTKLNSLVTNGGSNPGSPTRSPSRPISPIRFYRGSDTRGEKYSLISEESSNENGVEKNPKKDGDEAESTYIAGIPPSLSSSTSYGGIN